MASTIKVKRSAVQGKAPTTSNLDAGELALNTRDGRLYSKGTQVFEVGANNHSLYVGTGGATFANGAFSLPTSDGTADQVIKTNGSGVLSWVDQSGGGELTGSVPFYAYDNTLDTINLTSQISSTALANTNAYIATKADIASPSFTGNTSFDTNTLFVDSTNNRVGIGTSSPQAKLQVANDQGGGSGRILLDANVSSGYETRIDATDTGFEFTTKSTIRPFIFQTGSSSTEQMRIANSGAVTKPNQPAFLAKFNPTGGDQTLSSGSSIALKFDSEVYDVGSNFNTSTYTFTAPVGGIYVFTFMVRVDNVDHTASYYRPEINTSNYNYYNIFDTAGFDSTTSYQSFGVTVMTTMDSGDVATARLRQQGGTNSHVDDGDGYSWFSGYLLG